MRRIVLSFVLALVLLPLAAHAQELQQARTQQGRAITVDPQRVIERMKHPLASEDCFGCVLGIWDDPGLTQRTGTITPGIVKDLYVGIKYAGPFDGLTGLEFSISGLRQVEDGILVLSVDDLTGVSPFILLGTVPSPADTSAASADTGGINVAWGSCITGSQALLKVSILTFTTISEKVIWVKRRYPPTNEAFHTPVVYQCDVDFTATRVTGGCYGLNLTGTLPCESGGDLPPVCDAGGPYTPACTSPTTSVVLDGTGSFDPEGGPLGYLWASDCPGALIINSTSPVATLLFSTPPGSNTICNVRLQVDDGVSASACTTTVGVDCGVVDQPPVCDAGGPYTPACTSPTTSVTLDGTGSFDPEGRPLGYLWTSDCPGALIVNSTSPVATLLFSTPPGSNTTCNVRLRVNDAVSASICSTTVAVECGAVDQPPVCDAGGPYEVRCEGPTTAIQLDGTGSFDPDVGDTLNFSWSSDCPGASFDDSTSATPTLVVDSRCCPLECSVTLVVSDGHLSSTCSAPIHLLGDGGPPAMRVLWPPDHQYVRIEPSDCLAGGCSPGGPPVAARVIEVRSDEPEDAQGNGDGATLDDIVIECPDVVLLRAERAGNGDGRVYTITYEVLGPGGPQRVDCKVAVPHDQAGAPAVEGPGPGYTVAASCTPGATRPQTTGLDGSTSTGFAKAQIARGAEPGIAVSFALEQAGPVVLDVYDIAGRHLAAVRAELAAGSQVLLWNGRDRDGRLAANGIYLMQLRADGAVRHFKALWMH
jgi:hypothetical protein